ncbi:MAG: biliverdin-producing heme oxygenase [Saprospiraceae bacterium]
MMLNFLKENTTSIHQQVEQDNLAKYILDHSISKDNYEKLLLQNYQFYKIIEEELILNKHHFAEAFYPFLTCSKSDALGLDLKNFGQKVSTLILPDYNFNIQSSEEAVGALYVSEGSALGGLLIGKHLKKCPKLNFISRHNFFGNDAPIILSKWKNFKQTVEQHSATLDKDKTLSAAIKTFQLFGKIIQS